ncbi:hypothetical protein GQ53DRAFT_26824 [Thozetella sp. PMI_491]|nr:hypothetical protein GQ53DRAFT_26824 [Thozetella sp. PMI_491]
MRGNSNLLCPSTPPSAQIESLCIYHLLFLLPYAMPCHAMLYHAALGPAVPPAHPSPNESTANLSLGISQTHAIPRCNRSLSDSNMPNAVVHPSMPCMRARAKNGSANPRMLAHHAPRHTH